MKKILAATFRNLGGDFYAASHRDFMTEAEIEATPPRSQPITLTTRLFHFSWFVCDTDLLHSLSNTDTLEESEVLWKNGIR